MKKIITALALSVAMISPSMAATDHDTCVGVSELAEQVMKSRLNGVKITDAMEVANGAGAMKSLMTEIVSNAYKTYGYKTDEYQDSTIKDFGATYYLDCMKHSK